MSKAVKVRKPMSSKSKGTICLVLLLALTVFVSYLSMAGMKLDADGVHVLLPWVPVSSENWPDSLPLSRALGGGTYTLYTAALPEDADESASLESELDAAAKLAKERLNQKGYTDSSVTVQDGALRIELPNMDDDLLSSVLAMATGVGHFEFRTADGETFMTGEDVQNSSLGLADANGTSFALNIITTEEGKEKLADATSNHIGEQLSVYHDGRLLVSATVNEAFTTGQISVPLSLTAYEIDNLAVQLRTSEMNVTLTSSESGELANNHGSAKLIMILAAAVLLLCGLIFMAAVGKLTAISGVWTAWCSLILEMFFYATIVLATITVPNMVALLVGVALAVYVAFVRTQSISRQIAAGNSPKSAAKLGFRAAGKHVWLVIGVALAVSLVLMLFSFSKVLGYTLCAGVVATAFTTPLMRLFQACFLAISNKAGSYGKAK